MCLYPSYYRSSADLRICHVCNGHSADDGRVFHRACCELAKAGYEVHLLAESKGTKAYEEKGVIIHPLPECKSRAHRHARAFQVARIAAALDPDLFHVHEPDLLGPIIAKAKRRPVIYDVHESYLDLLSESKWLPSWMKPVARVAWDRLERRLVRRCAGVVVATAPLAQRYFPLHEKVQVVANYPELNCDENLPPIKRDGITCVFAGVLRPDRGIAQMFKALALLKERGLVIRLALAGLALSHEYLASLWDEAKRLGIHEQLQYYGTLSKREALMLQHQASIGLIADLPYCYFRAALPTKLVECMSLGLPVVCSDLPLYRAVAGETGAGFMVDPTSAEQIADAVERLVLNPALARKMGEAGRRAVRERFNWEAESKKLLELYNEVLGARSCNSAASESCRHS